MAKKPFEYSEKLVDPGKNRNKPLEPVISQELIEWLDYTFMNPAFTFKDDLRRMDFKHGEQNVVRALRRLRSKQLDPNYIQG